MKQSCEVAVLVDDFKKFLNKFDSGEIGDIEPNRKSFSRFVAGAGPKDGRLENFK